MLRHTSPLNNLSATNPPACQENENLEGHVRYTVAAGEIRADNPASAAKRNSTLLCFWEMERIWLDCIRLGWGFVKCYLAQQGMALGQMG